MNPLIQLKKATPVFLVALTCFAFSPIARAVNPPPDGGYPSQNTAEGDSALFSLTTGIDNTAIGFNALFSNTTGSFNTATGIGALLHNTTGVSNTANGTGALQNNTTGSNNTANGFDALFNNTTGIDNTANGTSALAGNSTGAHNTATGFDALLNNTTGSFDTANGDSALQNNAGGSGNTANGFQALLNNTTGGFNTANGDGALNSNTMGNNNTATGDSALSSNTTGGDNTVNGVLALALNTTGSNNTANGFQALLNNTTGSNNIALGANAGANLTTGGNNIEFGNAGVAGESATIRIGTTGTQTKTFIAGIHGIAVVSGTAVKVNAVGQLGTLPSSKRFKDQIKPMDKTSEVIYLLKPVTFQYKKELDPDKTPQFGLIAEEVEKANRDLVDRDAQGKVYTVRYEAVDAMLLNEFLKEHRKVEQLEKQIEALTAGLQKVSAQIEMSRPTSQTVLNSR